MPDTKINVKNNGPLVVEGEIHICDADGKEFDVAGRTVIALCRCGKTGNAPFCDGSHKNVFQSEVQARRLPPPAPR